MARVNVDESNSSFQRIEEKCINCGQCLATCKKLNNLDDGDCINCGQCILTCPVGALQPKYNYKEVLANVHDEETIVVVSISPAVRVAIGDEFGYNPGEFLEGKLVGVLKQIGFDYVFDTTFGADLTIMEEASELLERIKANKTPMFTSCCPSWVLNMEKYHSADLDLLSSCKSPIGMQGSAIKNYFAKLKNLNPKDIVTVSLAPCVSKKTEVKEDLNNDYVITTSELAMLIRELKIDFQNVKEAKFDNIFGKGTGGGVIFGASGGVMESALRTAYYLANNKKAPDDFFNLTSLRESSPIKEAEVDLGIKKLKVAVIYGINNVNNMYDELKKYDFVEVMTCSSGCVGGAGQSIMPQNKQSLYVEERKKSLFQNDSNMKIRSSYENEDIKNIYKDYLKYPLSSESKKILHTTHKVKEKIAN
jgi:ferredoxin hydrogenase